MNLHINKRTAWLTSAHWAESCSQHAVRASRQPHLLPALPITPQSGCLICSTTGPSSCPASPPHCCCPWRSPPLSPGHAPVHSQEPVQAHSCSETFPSGSFLRPPQSSGQTSVKALVTVLQRITATPISPLHAESLLVIRAKNDSYLCPRFLARYLAYSTEKVLLGGWLNEWLMTNYYFM